VAEANAWKLQDAKARFSELVRRARTGQPQRVTVHGKDAVVVVDAERYEVRPKSGRSRTMAGFIEESKKYRGVTEGVDFRRGRKVKSLSTPTWRRKRTSQPPDLLCNNTYTRARLLVSRNVRDFVGTGVVVYDPWNSETHRMELV
jgi:prevent-host-death family protein